MKSKILVVFFLGLSAFASDSAHSEHNKSTCIPCAREGGFIGLNLGYCGGYVKNNSVTGIGSPLSSLDIEIPQGPTVIGYIHPEALQPRFHQSGFIAALEMGYDFKVGGQKGQSWLLGWFANGSLSTTRGSAEFPGDYTYPTGDVDNNGAPIMSAPVGYQEKLRVRNKGFWSTGFRFGPTVDRMFVYVKGGFLMTRMSISLPMNSLSRLIVPSRTRWFQGGVAGVGIEFQVTPVFVIGVDLTANMCAQKEMVVAFPDIGGAILVQTHPFYGQAMLTLKYKFPVHAAFKPSAIHSVYRPQW